MKKLAFLVSLLILGLASVTSTFACSCMMPESPEKEMEKASWVFIWTVLDIEKTNFVDELFTYKKNVVNFNVSSVIKWDNSKNIEIKTAEHWATCGYYFEKWKEYIVYTYWEKWNYEVSLCSRTKLTENAQEDLEAFNDKISIPETDNTKKKTSFKEILISLIFIMIVIIFVLLTANKRTKKD